MAKKDIGKIKSEKAAKADSRLDLEKIIKVDTFCLNNVYDERAVLFVLNRKNKLKLTMDDVVFDSFNEHEAKLRAQNREKYKGRKVIYYEQAKNTGYKIWIIISLIALFLSIAILLPIGLIGDSKTGSWHDAGKAVLISVGPIAAASFISTLVCVLCWKGEIPLKQLATVESKIGPKEDEETKAEVEEKVEEKVEKEYIKKTS